jgi:replicative DNA helicase
MARIETTILSNLLISEKFARVAIPFLRPEFFQDRADNLLIQEITRFFNKHNRLATREILNIELQNRTDVSDRELESALERVEEITTGDITDHDWLVDQTEAFCKKKSVYLAILESIKILDGKEKTQFNEDAIPKILQDALAVSFNSEVGHNYLADAASRFDSYTLKEDKIPFDLEEMNAVTKGGMSRKALYAVSAESGGGKSIFMTHTAAATLKQGRNVLYITMEMSEQKIAERIDANLLKVNVDSLKDLAKDDFVGRVERISRKTMGKLYIKEYPTGGAHSGHFRGLLEELKTKQNFMPDLVIVDYLGICASARVKMGGTVNTYSYQKAIAEELRGLAVEYNIAMLTGAQLNRSGYSNSDVEMSSVADSMGIVMALDFFFALISTDELKEMGQVLVKILKNRSGDVSKFVLGLNRARMTFFDLEDSAQTNIAQTVNTNKYVPKTRKEEADVPLFDKTRTGRTVSAEDFKF